MKTGSSYLSQSELPLTFGLGDADTIAKIEVKWPDASAALGTGHSHPRVRTWGGRTPDGTDPQDPEERNAPRTAAEIIEDGRRG